MSCSCMAIKIWRIYLEVHPGIYPAWLITMENHHFLWVNPLCLWPFSIAMFVYQRVSFLQPIYIVRVFPVRIYLSCNIVIYALNWDARSSGLVWKCDTANSSPVGYSDSKILPIKMDPSLGQTQLILLAACVYIYTVYCIYIHLKVPSETRYWSRSRSFLFSTAKPMLSQCHLQSSGLLWVVTVWHVHSHRPVSPLVSYLELQAGTCSAGITRPLT